MLGLKHNTNVLLDYQPGWPAAFAEEAERIGNALAGIALGIEHYGSTAVPGLPAKPIIDILVGVAPLSRWSECHDPLLALGYDYASHAGVPGHHIFGRGRDRTERTHLVHVVTFDDQSWRENLAFRDALRQDAHLRASYLELKRAAAAAAPDSRSAYNAHKQDFIAGIKARLRSNEQSS
jgi:GrpB-like predicted nucleotidyltransferase (UPF0157 family)